MNCFVLRTFTILSTLRFGRGGFQGLSSTYEQAHVDLDLLTLASYYVYSYFLRFTSKKTLLYVQRADRHTALLCTP